MANTNLATLKPTPLSKEGSILQNSSVCAEDVETGIVLHSGVVPGTKTVLTQFLDSEGKIFVQGCNVLHVFCSLAFDAAQTDYRVYLQGKYDLSSTAWANICCGGRAAATTKMLVEAAPAGFIFTRTVLGDGIYVVSFPLPGITWARLLHNGTGTLTSSFADIIVKRGWGMGIPLIAFPI